MQVYVKFNQQDVTNFLKLSSRKFPQTRKSIGNNSHRKQGKNIFDQQMRKKS